MMAVNVNVNVSTAAQTSNDAQFPLSMPVTFYSGGNAPVQLQAQWTNLLSTVKGQQLAVLYQDGTNTGLAPGLGVNNDSWQLAIPYTPYVTNYVINGGSASVFYNVTQSYPIPNGAIVFRNGAPVSVSSIPSGSGVWAILQLSSVAITNPYVLPTASNSTLGGIKIGTGLNVDINGVASTTVLGTQYWVNSPLITTQEWSTILPYEMIFAQGAPDFRYVLLTEPINDITLSFTLITKGDQQISPPTPIGKIVFKGLSWEVDTSQFFGIDTGGAGRVLRVTSDQPDTFAFSLGATIYWMT
jgi:hypothetical protein